MIINSPGIITSYRRGRHRIYPQQLLCKFQGFDSDKEASQLIGHEMEWISNNGASYRGTITRVHGRKGVVRVQLSTKGVPGDAIGQDIKIIK
nr:50S ribosomal protein L35ae [Candidatus Sigynarchaeota archaeon]